MIAIMYNPAQFTLQSTAEANYLYVTPAEDAVYDLIAVRMLSEDAPEFLLPLQVSERNGAISLRYKLINGTALKYSTDTAMTKKQYVTLARDLLTPFMQCKDWLLDYHAICIDPAYILRDRHTDSFLFAYLPADSLYATDAEILEFIRATLAYIDITDDKDFQIRMMRYFRDGGYTLGDMYTLFCEEASRLPQRKTEPAAAAAAEAMHTATAPKQNAAAAAESAPAAPEKESSKKGLLDLLGINAAQKSEPKTEAAPAAESSAAAAPSVSSGDSVMDALFGTDNAKSEKKDAGGIFGGLFGNASAQKPAKKESKKSADALSAIFGGSGAQESRTKAAAKQEQSAPAAKQTARKTETPPMAQFSPMGAGETFIGDDRTMLDDDMGASSGGALILKESMYDGCPSEISLAFAKPFIVFGRQTKDTPPDVVFPENCKGVSRQHLRISRLANGTLTVTDLGSSFGTLLDGQRLIPNTAYPLANGATLTLVEKEPIRYTVHI